MDLQLFVRSNRELFSKSTLDGLLILGPGDKNIYILKGAGTLIWDEADGKKTVKEIIEYISQEFDVDSNVAKKDTIAFLKDSAREAPSLFTFSKVPFKI